MTAVTATVIPATKQDLRRRKRTHSDNSSDDDGAPSEKSASPALEDDRRAHHNELERRRRDHIKDHFNVLRDMIPLPDADKTSRAQILKRAVEYINVMDRRLKDSNKEMEQLKKKNEELEEKMRQRLNPTPPPTTFQPAPIPQSALSQSPPSTSSPSLLYGSPVQQAFAPVAPAPLNLPVTDGLPSLLGNSQDDILLLAQALLQASRLAPQAYNLPSLAPQNFSLQGNLLASINGF